MRSAFARLFCTLSNTCAKFEISSRLGDIRGYEAQRDAICSKPAPFDVVLVHSVSRFYRDPIGYGLSKRKLEKHGTLLISMTQDFGTGAAAEQSAALSPLQRRHGKRHPRL